MSEVFRQNVALPDPGTYVVAVSGGVDSAVLLDVLARSRGPYRLLVAHVDHGIRPESPADARFVAALAEQYGLPFKLCNLSLGASAGEAAGRRARYAFLRAASAQHEAAGILTAHHADDVVETVVLNLLRGTGWRGLCSLRSHDQMARPLLGVDKQDILAYALERRLEWREDATNHADIYTRNRIRHGIIPAAVRRDPAFKAKIQRLSRAQGAVRTSVESELDTVCGNFIQNSELSKAALVALDAAPALEVLRSFLLQCHVRQTRPQLMRALAFARTAAGGKRFSLGRRQFLEIRRHTLVVVTTEN